MTNKIVNIAAMLILTQIGTLPVLAASPVGSPTPLDKTFSAATAPGTQTAKSSVQVTSVLERFRTYSGPRTPAALMALFATPVTAVTIHQQPEVALSDGASMVKITIDVGSQESKSPNVAFNDAQLISLMHDRAGKWDVEALPSVGTWNASLILLTDSGSREVPLTVAPRLPAGIDLSEKGFVAYLGGAKASARPLLDLNNDGRRDYLDDYIFTANYLVGTSTAANVPDTVQVSDSQTPTSDWTPQSPVQDTVQTPEPQDSVSDQGSYSQITGTSLSPNSQSSPNGQGTSAVSTAGPVPAKATPTAAPSSYSNTSTAGGPVTIKLAPEVVPSSDPHNLNNRNQRARDLKRSKAPAAASEAPAAAVPPVQ